MWDGTHPHCEKLYSALRNGASMDEITAVVPEDDIRSGRRWTQGERDAMSALLRRYIPRGWSTQGAAHYGMTRRAGRNGEQCHYCGVPSARDDGECQDCGSSDRVAQWLA